MPAKDAERVWPDASLVRLVTGVVVVAGALAAMSASAPAVMAASSPQLMPAAGSSCRSRCWIPETL
jgi:hypothetical protein